MELNGRTPAGAGELSIGAVRKPLSHQELVTRAPLMRHPLGDTRKNWGILEAIRGNF